MKQKLPKCFFRKDYPRSSDSEDMNSTTHNFGVDVFIHFIQSEEKRNPYVLIWNNKLTFSFPIDIIEMKEYYFNNEITQDELLLLKAKLTMYRNEIISFWNDKFCCGCEKFSFLEVR